MRRIPLSGTGWLVLAAAAAPIIIKASKPLAKKVGESFEKFGKKLQEEAREDTPNKKKEADRPEAPVTEQVKTEAKAEEDTTEEPKATATKVRQSQPKPKTTAKPRPKKTVKSSPAKPRTTTEKPPTPEN